MDLAAHPTFDLQNVPSEPVPGDLPVPHPIQPPSRDPQDLPPPMEDPDVVDPSPLREPPPMIACDGSREPTGRQSRNRPRKPGVGA